MCIRDSLEAGNGVEALRRLAVVEADVVLMDVRMPELDGLATTARLTATDATTPGRHPTPKIIVLTTFDLDEYVLAAIKAGASGFLLKDAPPEEMLAAIRTCLLYTSDAADDLTRVDLGGRRIIKKKKKK